MQSEHDLAAQSGFSPVHAPATPSNGRQATPSSSTSQTLQLTPSQAEGLAQLGLSALIPNNTTFSPDSVVSPQSPAYSQNSGEMNGVGTMSPYYAGTPASGADPNTRMVPRALNMDIDLSAFPPSPHSASAHSASGSSTGAATPGTNALRTPYYYPPAGTPVHPPHPTVQRHHPYAHPAHPPRSSQPPSSSALPLYLTTPASAPPTAPTSSASDIPPSAPIASPASNGAFSPSVADPPAVQRVHSAPAHILTLSNGVQDGEGGPSSAMDEGGAPPFGGATAQEWDPNMATPQMSGAGASGTPQGVSGDWQMEQGHARPPELVKQEESQPGFFDGSFAYAQGQPVFTQQQQAPPPPPQQHHVPQPPPPTPMSAIQLVDAVSAIALLRNRLPIMEAALSTSASDPGGDEEEIWKGVEGAYGELKRIMMSRKDARRGLGRSGTLKAATNRGYSMDLEAPNTPMESRPPSSTSTFLNVHSHPPLLHSQSSPDVPTVSNAQRAAQAAQQAQDVANAQAVIQRQQAAMQQAQLQQQQQQQLQQQMQQAEAQARADAEGRARAEAEQRARAEDESRLKIEAEAQARADAEAAEAAARRDQQEQYERAVAQQQQHQQQQAIAQQQQQQQQQQQLQMHQMQEEHFRHQHEQQMRNQQMAEAQAHAQQPADAQQQQQQQFNAPTDFSLTPQPQLNSVTPQAITNPLPTHLTLSTNLPPSQQSASASPTSRTGTPFTISQQTALVPQNTFAYDANGDMSMGAVMQMHMSNGGTPFSAAPPEGLAPSAILPPPPADDNNAGWGSGSNYAALQAAATGVANLGLSAQASIPSPPSATANLATRPTRSRAASGSGYVSASGSRSRAASGSGYQSLLETRSRAASSASSVFNMYERDDEDELEEDDGDHGQPVKVSSQMGAASAGVDPELKARMDPVFMEFLADLCSNLDATDSKGEPIHQTLMAKKMEKLDQSTDFRPFKFRIQAFTTAFGEKLIEAGFHETEIPIKKIRQYLWAQPCISRFNDDGKKAKSKGNHIWTIEAKKAPEKKWIFREFVRCIKGIPPSVAFVGLPWVWSPRVWDPQCAISPSDAVFHSPALPSWLSWDDNTLSGEAPESLKGQTFEIEAIATFQGNVKSPELRMTCTVVVASPNDHEDPTTHIPIPGQLIDTSTQSSAIASPSASATSLQRSPVLRQGSFSSASRHNSFSEQQPPQQLLPSLMAPAAQASGSNSLASSLSSMDQQQRQADQDFQLAIAQQQEQQRQQQQQYIDAAMQANANEMQLDAESLGQQPGFDPSFEAQANLHRHYSAMAAQQSLPFDSASPASLSFAPPPDLVQTALQQAAMNPTFVPHNPNGLLSHPHSEVGTPGGYIGEVDGRLASFVLSNQQQQQQQPYTLDPSQL